MIVICSSSRVMTNLGRDRFKLNSGPILQCRNDPWKAHELAFEAFEHKDQLVSVADATGDHSLGLLRVKNDRNQDSRFTSALPSKALVIGLRPSQMSSSL